MAFDFDTTTARLFVAVAEEGSIAAAARRENIAASAVSKRITEVEKQFGVQLLVRSAEGVGISTAGQKFLRRAQNILLESSALDAELRSHSVVEGHVRVAANETALVSYLPSIIQQFMRDHPGVTIDLDEKNGPDAIRAVERQVADIGIFVGTNSINDLEVFPCFRDRIVAIVRSDHPLADQARVRLEELVNHDIIGHDRRVGLQQLERAAAAAGLNISIKVRVNGHDVVSRLVEVGIGVGIISEAFSHRFIGDWHLTVIPIDEPWAQREHRVAIRQKAALPEACNELFKRMVSRSPIPPSLDYSGPRGR